MEVTMWKQTKQLGKGLTQPTIKEYGTLEKGFTTNQASKKLHSVIKSTKNQANKGELSWHDQEK